MNDASIAQPDDAARATPAMTPAPHKTLVRRHALATRIFHWINFAALTIMLGSGLQIFNAHPALYWGVSSDFRQPALSIGARRKPDGQLIGVTTVGDTQIDTTGLLGVSKNANGRSTPRGFPGWATIPSVQWLSMGRQWHFFFAWIFVLNGLAYLLYSLLSGHIRRDLLPRLRELGHIGRDIINHALLRFPKGEEARHYNVLQKLTYLIVLFGLGPLILATGLTMSPTVDAHLPWLPELFGGRQSARTIHFICAFSFLAFFIVHIVMVVLSGLWNNLRSMVTGRYAVEVAGNKTGENRE